MRHLTHLGGVAPSEFQGNAEKTPISLLHRIGVAIAMR